MTSLLEGAKKLVTRGSDIGARIDGLERAAAAARGRLDDGLVGRRRGGRRPRRRTAAAVGRPHRRRDRRRDRLRQVLHLQRPDRARALRGRRPPPDHVVGHRLRVGQGGRRGAARVARHPAAPPGDPRLDARPRPTRTPSCAGVVLLDLPDHDSTEVSHHLEVDRLVAARRPAGVGRSTRRSTPTPRSTTATSSRWPATGRDARGAQPHRHRARGPRASRCSTTYAACSTPTASTGCRCWPVSARHGMGIDELRAEIAKRVAEKKVDPRPPRGRRAGRRRAAAGRGRHRQGADRCRAERVAALDDAFADAAGVPTVVKAVEPTRRGCAPTAPPAGRSPRGSPGSSPTRSSGCTSTSARPARSSPAPPAPRCPRRPRCSAPGSTPRCAPSPTRCGEPWRPSWAARRARGRRSRGCPTSATGSTRRVADTDLGADRIPVWAGLVRVLQWRPDRLRAGRRRLARAAGLRLLRPAARAADPRGRRRSRSRPCCCSAGSGSGCCWRWSAGCWSSLDGAGRGRGRPTSGCATAISEVSAELVVEPIRGRAGGLRRGPRRPRPRPALSAPGRPVAGHWPSTARRRGAGRPQPLARSGRRCRSAAEPWVIAADPPPPTPGDAR